MRLALSNIEGGPQSGECPAKHTSNRHPGKLLGAECRLHGSEFCRLIGIALCLIAGDGGRAHPAR